MAGFAILTVFEAVFPPEAPLGPLVPTHGHTQLLYRLVKQLNTAQIALFPGSDYRQFFAAHAGLPVQQCRADEDNQKKLSHEARVTEAGDREKALSV